MKKIIISIRFAARIIIVALIILSLIPTESSRAQSGDEPGTILTPEGFTIETSPGGFPINIAPWNTRVHSFDQMPTTLYPDQFSTGTTTRVSVSSSGEEGNRKNGRISINASGRFIAFSSDSTDLVSGDVNDKWDIYVHDRLTGWTYIVSVSSNWYLGNSDSRNPSISADGRYVVFSSAATNLVKGDTNHALDIFVRDLLNGKTSRVSVSSTGMQVYGHSDDPSINADGRFVAFTSGSQDLVDEETVIGTDIFIHDCLTGSTSFVSTSSEGEPGNANSGDPSISADGRYVTFESEATNLVDADTNAAYDVFVHDNQTGETMRVFVSTEGIQANGYSFSPSISSDGRYVAFHSSATNLISGDINGKSDVFVHDRQTGETTLISHTISSGVHVYGDSSWPSISADGRYVTFESDERNLVDGDVNGHSDIFIHDGQTDETTLVSVSSTGIQGNHDSVTPSISADGLKVAFLSAANNLVPDDTNNSTDVFLHDLGGEYSISGCIQSTDLPNITDTTIYIADEYGWLITSGKVNSAGCYRFIGAPAGTYLLVPWKNGYFFTPEYLYVTVPADAVDQNFTAVPVGHSPESDEKLTTSKVTFSWDALPGAIKYRLQLSTNSSFSTPLLDVKVSEPSYFFDSSLPYKTTYYWRIRPLYADGKDPWLPTWQFNSMDPLAKVELISPADEVELTSTLVPLSWTSVVNGNQYKVQVSKVVDFSVKLFNQKLDPGDLPLEWTAPGNGKYYWRVRALDPYGAKGPWSETRNFKVRVP